MQKMVKVHHLVWSHLLSMVLLRPHKNLNPMDYQKKYIQKDVSLMKKLDQCLHIQGLQEQIDRMQTLLHELPEQQEGAAMVSDEIEAERICTEITRIETL